MHSLVSIKDLSREEIEFLIQEALQRKAAQSPSQEFHGKVLASLFYENSTRTRESHERAARRLGMDVIGFSGTEGTSVKKGEPIADTLRMYQGYGADIIVLRHPLEGAARYAADILNIPVINAGDGSNAHPTQTLLDLMTIKEKRGSIDNVRIALVGDLKYGRTVHSLIAGLSLFNNVQIWLVAPDSLQMPSHIMQDFEKTTHSKAIHTADLHDAIDNVDILYMTRIQRERFPEGPEGEYEFQKLSRIYQLTALMLKERAVGIMHPLPRYKKRLEISLDVDALANAWYLEQAKNGLFMREALLSHMLSGKTFTGRKTLKAPDSLWEALPIKDGKKKGEHMVYRLDNGTLIDHIRAGRGKEVLRVLDMSPDAPFIYACNIRSQRTGKKDVVGITDRELTADELSRVALVTPDATVNIIRNRTVHKKGKVILPPLIESIILCQNPQCITSKEHYEHAPHIFHVESHEPLLLRCHYCELPVTRDNISLA